MFNCYFLVAGFRSGIPLLLGLVGVVSGVLRVDVCTFWFVYVSLGFDCLCGCLP